MTIPFFFPLECNSVIHNVTYEASVKKKDNNNNNNNNNDERLKNGATEVSWKNKWFNHKFIIFITENTSTVHHYQKMYG